MDTDDEILLEYLLGRQASILVSQATHHHERPVDCPCAEALEDINERIIQVQQRLGR